MKTHSETFQALTEKNDELLQQFKAGEIDPVDYMNEHLVLANEIDLFSLESEFVNKWGLNGEEWASLSHEMKKAILKVGRQAEKHDRLVEQVREWVGECPV